MTIRWTRVAALESREARRFYESEQPGLGAAFVAELKEAVLRVRAFPLAWPVVEEPVRRIVINRFPYLLHYVIDDDVITVIGVYHARRAPIHWRDRLS